MPSQAQPRPLDAALPVAALWPTAVVGRGLAIDRGGRRVIDGLDFEVRASEALLLTGANGAGKTTLLRTIAGFLSPIAGTLALDGGAADIDIGEQCHYVGHLNAVKPSLTVVENLSSWQTFLGGEADRPTALQAALDRMALMPLADIPVGYLSAGQRRRLGLARLLVARRPLWLLDEPTVSLDAASVGLVAATIREHLRAGGLAIAATHLDLGLGAVRELRLGSA